MKKYNNNSFNLNDNIIFTLKGTIISKDNFKVTIKTSKGVYDVRYSDLVDVQGIDDDRNY